jgi:hypothetical protein
MSSQEDLLRPLEAPAVPLRDLLVGASVQVVSPHALIDETIVSGLTVNSRQVVSGDVFVALAGLKAHGARFAAGAVAQGASVILTDHAGVQVLAEQDFGDSAPVIVQGPQGDLLRGEMAQWASRIYGAPSQRLSVSGLTGTNGKTTTAFFLDAIHRWVGERTALLGTVEMRLADVAVPSTRTTVESPVLQGFFSRCVQEGIDHVTMEVSSHALALARVDGTRFGVVGCSMTIWISTTRWMSTLRRRLHCSLLVSLRTVLWWPTTNGDANWPWKLLFQWIPSRRDYVTNRCLTPIGGSPAQSFRVTDLAWISRSRTGRASRLSHIPHYLAR